MWNALTNQQVDATALQAGATATIAAVVTAWSLFILLFGYRYYRLVAMLQGITIGAALGAGVGLMIAPQQPMVIYLSALAAVGLLVPCFYYISVFIIGFTTSALIVGGLSVLVIMRGEIELSSTAVWTVGIIGGLAGVVGGVLALRYHRGVIILVTSIAGALMGVAAALTAALGASAQQPVPPSWWQMAMALGVAIVLAVIGVIIQNKGTRQESAIPAGRQRGAAVGPLGARR